MNGTPSPATELVIYGAGGMGQEAADLAISAGYDVLGFVDDREHLAGEIILGLPILGDRSWLLAEKVPVVVALGAPADRRRLCEELTAAGLPQAPYLVHPGAYVGRGCEIGVGSLVGAGATLTVDVEVGRYVIVNVGATISHNSRLADFVTIAPGAHLAGNTRAEEGAEIGIGASLKQGLTLGAWSIIGAGAVVIADVASDTTVAGCPARKITTRETGWHL